MIPAERAPGEIPPSLSRTVTGPRRRLATLVRAALGIGLLALVVSRLSIPPGTWTRAGVAVLTFVALSPIGACVESLRLRWIVRVEGIELPFLSAMRIVLSSAFFALAIPGGTGGDVVKVYYLGNERSGHLVEMATLVLLDRAIALVALVSVGIVAASFIPGSLVPPALARFFDVAVLLDLLGIVAGGAAVWKAGHAAEILESRGWSVGPLGWLVRILRVLAKFTGRRRLLAAVFAAAAVGHAAMLCGFAIAAVGVLGATHYSASAALAATGLVANALPLTPLGLGVGEAAFERLFELLGLQGGSLLLISWRIGCLPILLVGLGVYLFGGARSHAR